MVTVKELRQKCRKEYWGFYNKAMHEIGFYFARIFINTPVTPNQITVFWLFLGLAGGILMASGSYLWMLVGIIIYHLTHFFDCVDGDLARYRKQFTVKGLYLEQIAHHITMISVLVGLSIGVFKIMNNFLWLYAGIVLVFSFILLKLFSVNLAMYKNETREKVSEVFYNSSPKVRGKMTAFIFSFIRLEHPLNIMFWLILFNQAHLALLFYMVLYFLEMWRKLFTTVSGLQRIDSANKKQ